ncbi:OmpA family protein [Fluviicoccus keumensis]|uniref:OmpA family protein n=1 Tax=Fluviicoccus keumensis TaxID=1435465 RepID=A0A4Q7YJV5_9GAMM|nr:OmpA family protein [Fluviicoccus keumensis]RZU36765.1 OmpA family protein [Fluviicoccus keumensis]
MPTVTFRTTLVTFSSVLAGCHSLPEPVPAEIRNLEPPSFVTLKNFTPSDIATIEAGYETMLCAGCEGNAGFTSGDTVFWIRFKPSTPDNITVEENPKSTLKAMLQAKNFGFNQYQLNGDLSPLQAILDAARQSVMPIRIIGHTDNLGSAGYNLKLSRKRAQEIADWLIAHGINAERIAVSGEGENTPIASNKTSEGRAANRRAEVTLTVMVMP